MFCADMTSPYLFEDVTHLAFGDETKYNTGRFRGIALVTLARSDYGRVSEHLRALLDASIVKEFKWDKLRSAQYRFAAERLLVFAIDLAVEKLMRVDVLMWDTHDSRHRVLGRDDRANMQRMYFHLLKNVLKKRWPNDLRWSFLPDRLDSFDWDNLAEFLERADTGIEIVRNDLIGKSLKVVFIQHFDLVGVFPVSDSGSEPLIQLADLFCGLGVFSREHYAVYRQWLHDHSPQLELVPREDSSPSRSLSRRDIERAYILNFFYERAKSKKMTISLNERQRLWTRNPRMPINFWWYEPQGDYDRAPTRSLGNNQA